MALNLWTTGGQSSSINPLSSTGTSVLSNGLGTYVITVTASSATGRTLKCWISPQEFSSTGQVTLTSTPTVYTFTKTITAGGQQSFQFADGTGSNGDIVLSNISVVKVPLAKNTINGVDGFLSGKWTNYNIAGGVQVLDDQTVQFTSTGIWQDYYIVLPVQPNTTYTLSFGNTVGTVYSRQSNSNTVVGANMGSTVAFPDTVNPTSITFTTNSTSTYLQIGLSSGTAGVGTFTFSKPMLNLGSTPAPYEPKRGDKMVLPIAKKNLIVQPSNNYGARWGTTVTKISDSEFKVVTIGANPDEGISFNLPLQYLGKTLTFSVDVMGSGAPLRLSQGESNVGAINPYLNISPTDSYTRFFNTFTNRSSFSSISNVLQVIVSTSVVSACTFYVRFPQLEEGTTATPYAPYAVQVNPKPKRVVPSAQRGLAFNGINQNITIPPLTLGTSFTIETMINLSSYTSDFRSGIVSRRTPANDWNLSVTGSQDNGVGYVQFMEGGSTFVRGGTKLNLNQWYKIKVIATPNFVQIYLNDILEIQGSLAWTNTETNQIMIGSVFNSGFSDAFNGSIQYVKFYDVNGNVVAQYDFMNPRTVTGTTVLANGNTNLLPSFDSGQWSLHANAKVLGKDVLHLDATGTWNDTIFNLPLLPNQNYLLAIQQINGGSNGDYYISQLDKDGRPTISSIQITSSPFYRIITTTSNTVTGKIVCSNSGLGSFDFIRPQLYQLNGTEGTINGAPKILQPHTKRRLFSKR